MNTNNATATPATASEFAPRPRPDRYQAALNIARDVLDLHRATIIQQRANVIDQPALLLSAFNAAGWGPCEAEDIPPDLLLSVCFALAQL